MTTSDAKTISEIYNKFGQAYHDSREKGHGRLFNEYLDMPATFSLLPNLAGKSVLDAGCGSGIYSRLLAKKGAIVSGIDISEKMVEIAKHETAKDANVSYIVGNLYTLPFEAGIFDLIVCNYVLENIEDIAKVFTEFCRVLKAHGDCIFSISHPLRAQSDKQVVDGVEKWVITDYFEEGKRMSDFGNGMVVPKYKRTIESYSNAIFGAGFVITSLLEPQPVKEGKEVDVINYEKSMRLPQLLTIKIRKNG